uniref:Leukocyte receptor cluster member 1 n=1 Tax=Eptatretus burgeri TaxID=7764 RepID=A0A8C4Q8K7_EPTBU
MNILPKKSWHVRNKDNVAKVRRDEAQARDEEKERKRRLDLAEQEARTDFLRRRIQGREARPAVETVQIPGNVVDLFGQKGDPGQQNAEHEADKRSEQEGREKAMGLLTYLGQSALASSPWYLEPRCAAEPDVKRSKNMSRDERRKKRMDPLVGMKREHDGREDKSSKGGPRCSTQSYGAGSGTTLAKMRAERVRREAAERVRARALLSPDSERGGAAPGGTRGTRPPQYNSQFHPELIRAKRKPQNERHFLHQDN